MAGTIYSGTYVTGIVLSDPTTQRPATVTGSVSNQNGDAIYGKPIARWTVANSGTIENTGSTGYGIDLGARGTVENGVSGATAALISGYGGVLIRGSLATVSNLGTISGTGKGRDGVELKRGGQVSNGSTAVTAAQISAGGHAVAIRNAAGTVRNFGTLTSTGTYNTVALYAGGSVSNGSNASEKALISGSASGVDVNHGAGTVTNFGTIDGYRGVVLLAGGRVTNGSTAATGALISGGRKGVYITGAAGAVANFGTIQVTGPAGYGVNLTANGTVVNLGTIDGGRRGVGLRDGGSITNGSTAATGALISGIYNGVSILGAAGRVTNFGTIQGTGPAGYGVNLTANGTVVNLGTIDGGHRGVGLRDGGRVTNGSTAATGALISGTRYGVSISGAADTVTNFGTIDGTGYGVNLTANGTVVNLGTIDGGDQGVVLRDGGRVTNGSTAATGALISGTYIGVFLAARGTVVNLGAITGAVGLDAGGSITNGSTAVTGALISGTGDGIFFGGPTGDVTVTNFGTIESAGFRDIGISLGDGGTVLNLGAITSTGVGSDGVFLRGGAVTNGSAQATGALISGYTGAGISFGNFSGMVTNFGTITSTGTNGYGVQLSGGTVTNGSAASTRALISGGVEIGLSGGGTVTNFGTISGGSSGVAVWIFPGYAVSKLVVEPGAVFIGEVDGNGVSRIDFETAGVAEMSGVSGFKTITLGNGENHSLTLTGANFTRVGQAITAITVDDGNSGNTVTAATLPAADRIIVRAGAGLDTLTGGAGNDVFYADGDTVMTGGAGRNEFIFSAPGGNTVGDFAVSATNEIVFSDKGFKLGLSGASGALPAGLFVENSDGHFTGTSQNFAYATGTGDLFYSASGSSGTPALVSHFTNAPSLAAAQLFFIT